MSATFLKAIPLNRSSAGYRPHHPEKLYPEQLNLACIMLGTMFACRAWAAGTCYRAA